MTTLTGYHGTNKENGAKILEDKTFKICGSFKDWLGKGAYFFENDKHQAYMFAKYKKAKMYKLHHSKICVLEASISSENFLDLLVDDDRKFLEEFTKEVLEQIKSKEAEIGEWEHKEGLVVDLLYETIPYDFVKAAYKVPKKEKDELLAFEPIQIQICVKNVECIDNICEVDCNAYEKL